MWPFNEEITARAIYESEIPIISAVGHETDFTIADFVADLRAPTPTGAAELAVPQIADVTNYLNQLKIRLSKTIQHKLKIEKQKLTEITDRYIFKNPINIYQIKEQQFTSLIDRLKYSSISLINAKEKKLLTIRNSYVITKPFSIIDNKSNKYLQLISKLETLSPLQTIKRGYSITKKDGKVISSVKDVKTKDKLDLSLMDGDIKVEVL